jgi:hypothetical protein
MDRENTLDHARGSLYFLPSAVGSTAYLGLSGGTLYDVLEPYVGSGNATVNAIGFNITCGYLTRSDVVLQYIPDIGMWNTLLNNQLNNQTFPLPIPFALGAVQSTREVIYLPRSYI